jgi:uncharacterized protein DUF4276
MGGKVRARPALHHGNSYRGMKAKKKERVGFIFECGREGPDYKVHSYFLNRLNDAIEILPRFLDNTENLLTLCGDVAAELLNECSRVVIMWDLEPAWEKQKRPRRCEDRARALKSLKDARVPTSKITLICVERELECWLMADKRALAKVIGKFKHPHPIGQMPDYTRPDQQIDRPKTALISLFQRELGRTNKYIDRNHALILAQAIPDWSKLKRSDSFRRFAERVGKVSFG